MSASHRLPDVGEQLMSFALNKDYPIDEKLYQESQTFPRDALGLQLDGYMISLLTGSRSTMESIVLHHGAHEIPSAKIANCMITSYFENFAPLYPILSDGRHFRAIYQQYAQSHFELDEHSRSLVNLVLAIGAAVANDHFDQERTAEVRFMRESLFTQAMVSSHTLHGLVSLQSAQIMVLLSFYLLAFKNLSTAWFWCGCAIRLLKSFGLRGDGTSSVDDEDDLKDKLLWCCFVLEKQLALLQFRSDMLLLESDIKPPSDMLKTRNPLLFLRVQLACLTHRFCALVKPGTMNPVKLADNVEQIYIDISAWHNSLQARYQPGGDVHADLSDHHFVLLMHLEYYGLLTTMFTTLDTTARLLPNYLNTRLHRSIRIRNQATIRMTNARRLLQTVIAIVEASSLGTKIICWLDSMEIIPSVSMIYAQVMKRPSLLCARTDAEMLSASSRIMDQYLSEAPNRRPIADIVKQMAIAATDAVHDARSRLLGIATGSPVSGSSQKAETEFVPALPLSERAQNSTSTPLGFYFNMEDRLQ